MQLIRFETMWNQHHSLLTALEKRKSKVPFDHQSPPIHNSIHLRNHTSIRTTRASPSTVARFVRKRVDQITLRANAKRVQEKNGFQNAKRTSGSLAPKRIELCYMG